MATKYAALPLIAPAASLLLFVACPLSNPVQPDGQAPSSSLGTLGTVETAPSVPPEQDADPTAAGPIIADSNGAPSPNKVIIGTTPPGVATGLAQAANQTPAANGNHLAVSANVALPQAANEVAQSPNVAAAEPNQLSPAESAPSTPVPAAPPAPTSSPATANSAAIWPSIGFVNYEGRLGSKVVALTFDDGPDGAGTGQRNTAAVLDFLKANNLKATFFVCSQVWTDLATDPYAQSDLKRIVAEGHDIGSHTYSHPHIDTIAPSLITQQFAQNLNVVRGVLGAGFSFTKIRAPFGFPFETNNPNVPWVAPMAAPFGVHVGWGIDTDDWKCAQNNQNSNCIMTNLMAQVAAGGSGPILMHAVYQLTVETLPQIVAYLVSQGYTFVTAEQLIVDKYGMGSAALMQAWAAKRYSAAQLSAAAVSECSKNNQIQVVY